MAQTAKEDAEGPGAGHNSDTLAAMITEAADTLAQLDAETDRINAAKREAKAPLKAAGIKMADFNAMFRLHKLGDEDRVKAVEAQRAVFMALKVGHQGALFPEPIND